MSYFKKFTDFCAGLAAFVVSLFFIRKYMDFSPPNVEEDAPGKLEQFLEPTANTDYSMLIPLILVLIASVAVGRIFQRLPYVCVAFSILPAVCVAYMLENGLLYENMTILIILVVLHVIGNLAECAFRDREDGRHRLSIGAKLTSAFGAVFCLYVTKLADKPLPAADAEEKLSHFETNVITNMSPPDMELITRLGWIFLGLLAISLLLYNVYFIDLILSVVPLVYSIHACYSGNLLIVPKVFMAISCVCFAAHLMLCVFENNLSYKEQKALHQTKKRKTA